MYEVIDIIDLIIHGSYWIQNHDWSWKIWSRLVWSGNTALCESGNQDDHLVTLLLYNVDCMFVVGLLEWVVASYSRGVWHVANEGTRTTSKHIFEQVQQKRKF